LSIPAKIFFIEKPSFFTILKRFSNLIDSKIVYESNTMKKKTNKKQTGVGNSVLLSNSRRTVLSQNASYIQPDEIKHDS
jgi:hypothetical protein